ncbi:MAG TPA: hypothetical protein VF076_07080 [Acidimicrobiales bacterium]
MAMSMSTTYTGRVASVNEKGLKLEGHESWLNFSKFAEDIVAPERGETVTVVVDKAGFLRAVQPLDGPVATNGHADAPRAAQTPSSPSARDTTITRLAVLKAAAAFGASRPELKSGDVLTIAASWERWINRPADGLDLAEAF